MKRIINTAFVILLAVLVTGSLALAAEQCTVGSYFSPYDNVEEVVMERLTNADKSIHCSLYGIEDQDIAKVMEARISKGVSVELCLDKMQSAGKASLDKELSKAGAKVEIKPVQTLEHNKFCVVDDNIVMMGSWNYSKNAQRQDNSMVIISGCPEVIKRFEDAFHRIQERDK